jgi:hypothetical protein
MRSRSIGKVYKTTFSSLYYDIRVRFIVRMEGQGD